MSTTKGSVTDHPFPYSDHEALTSELRLTVHAPTETHCGRKPDSQESDTGSAANLQLLKKIDKRNDLIIDLFLPQFYFSTINCTMNQHPEVIK